MISMTAVEFWELRRVVAFYPTAIYAPTHGKIMERYVLLVRRDNPAARLADLRGCTVGLFDGPYGNLCAVWAETLLLDQHLGRADSFWGTITTPTKVTQAVLPVFFSNSAACVVTSEGFRTMCALNPQLDRQLRVLAESPALVPSICCFRADYDSPYRDKFLAGMGRVAECAAGRQTLALVHSDGLVARPLSDMDAACALLDRHARLLAVVEAAAGTTAPAPPPATGERTP